MRRERNGGLSFVAGRSDFSCASSYRIPERRSASLAGSEALESEALESETVPSEPVPSEALPSEAVPSEAVPSESDGSQDLPFEALP